MAFTLTGPDDLAEAIRLVRNSDRDGTGKIVNFAEEEIIDAVIYGDYRNHEFGALILPYSQGYRGYAHTMRRLAQSVREHVEWAHQHDPIPNRDWGGVEEVGDVAEAVTPDDLGCLMLAAEALRVLDSYSGYREYDDGLVDVVRRAVVEYLEFVAGILFTIAQDCVDNEYPVHPRHCEVRTALQGNLSDHVFPINVDGDLYGECLTDGCQATHTRDAESV